ncbi:MULTISPECIES: TcpQ domain-containing protein [Alkalimonas]|uniref:TcpQ domain-containing protein n=1 Tax=Alkalimonas mucilaginosa TaxID=3057676 RepID=A0ABU7JFC7_9GAMM|nr:TcpQ domain-containing protein [Alkalimonas sp. MEB004]MEE2024200.1 TcpQ domain-containing protein [Alkalimonas sp. MEB004]
MWFWIRSLIITVLLSGLVYLLLFRPDFFSLDREQSNRAAEGLSSFYERIRGTIADIQLSDFVISLPDTSHRLTQQLQQRALQVSPLTEQWQGRETDRRFREGDTVKTKLEEYVQAEGLVLYWTLPRDYVVKQYFQTNGSMTAAITEVTAAIQPDFPSPLLSYLCHKERALVITDQPNTYVQQNCQPLSRH